jgi:hypothetical protein
MEDSTAHKLAVIYGGARKMVRTTSEYCGLCGEFRDHVHLRPEVFSIRLAGYKTQKVCVGCHGAGRYQGHLMGQFMFPSRLEVTAPALA